MNTPRRTAGQLNKETQKFRDETEQLKEETRQFSDSVTRTHAQITEMYTYLTSDKSASQKTEIDNLYNYLYLAKEGFLSRAKSFQQFIEESARLKIKYLGKKATNDEEEPQPGELKQMENEMKALLQKMQNASSRTKEILDIATAVGLSESFQKNADGFKKGRWGWLGAAVGVFGVGIYGAYLIINSAPPLDSTISNYIFYLAIRAPLVTVVVWAFFFVAKQYTYTLKLEQIYKHKAALATAYVGHKDEIKNLPNEDGQLLHKLMEDLLAAIAVDASEFINVKQTMPLGDLSKTSKKKFNEVAGKIAEEKSQ